MIVISDSRDFGSHLFPKIQWLSQGLPRLDLAEGSRFLAERMLEAQICKFCQGAFPRDLEFSFYSGIFSLQPIRSPG